jgi:hypothetical protein
MVPIPAPITAQPDGGLARLGAEIVEPAGQIGRNSTKAIPLFRCEF